MRLLSFGKFSYKLIYPFLLSVFSYLSFFFLIRLLIEFNIFKSHLFILFAFDSISELLCGLFELISIQKQKTEVTRDLSKKKSKTIEDVPRMSVNRTTIALTFLENTKFPIQPIKLYHILIMGVLKFSIGFILIAERVTFKTFSMDIFQLMRILFISILCCVIFKVKVHKHQVTSIIFVFCGIGIASIPSIIISSISIGQNYLIFKIFENVLYSILEVIEKYYMHFKYISPFRMLFYQGLVTSSLQVVSLIVLSFINCNILDKEYCSYTNIVEITSFFHDILNASSIMCPLYMGLYIMSMCGYNICRVMTNKEYTPTHRTIADTITCFFMFISFVVQYSNRIKPFFLYPQIIGYIIVLIGCLIYHEILLLYCCGMAYYTKVEIDKRGIKEVKRMTEYEKSFEIKNSACLIPIDDDTLTKENL